MLLLEIVGHPVAKLPLVQAPQPERTRRAAGIAPVPARPAARCPCAQRCWFIRAGHLSTRPHGWNECGDSLGTQNAALCGAGLETAALKVPSVLEGGNA